MNASRIAVYVTLLFASAASSVPSAAAEEPLSVPAPVISVGDRWVWSVTDKSDLMMGCSPGYPKGAREIETVKRVDEIGYETQIEGPMPDWTYTRKYLNEGTYHARAGDEQVLAGPMRFPLRPGNSWDATLASSRVVTKLKCEAKKPERMAFGKEEVEVIPIVCEGRWRNLQSGNGNTAEYKYWYSPVVGRNVRQTGFTYGSRGGRCFDAEWNLESYAKGK